MERHKLSMRVLIVIMLIAVSGFTSSCGQQDKTTLTLAGSRTVSQVVEVLAEKYKAQNSGISVNIQGVGSTAGIESAKEGVAEIGMASRLLKEEEKGLVAHLFAYDALAVIINPENQLDSISPQELQRIFAGEMQDWEELGQPPHKITLIDKESGSGTKAVFEELVMEDKKIASSAIVMDGTGAARSAVASDPFAIGYISAASVTNEVKALKINGVPADTVQVQAGKYDLVQPYLLVTKGEPTGLAKSFIDFILGSEGRVVLTENSLIPVK